MISANEQLQDAGIAHAIDKEGYKQGVVNRMFVILSALERDIVTRLLSEDLTTFSRTRLEAMLAQVRGMVDVSHAQIQNDLNIELENFTQLDVDFEAGSLQTVAVGYDVVRPTIEQVHTTAVARPFRGRHLREWYSSLRQSQKTILNEQIRLGYLAGESTDRIVRRLQGTVSKNNQDGAFGKTRRDVAGVVRTAVNHLSNHASEAVYEKNRDLIKGVQYLATLDGRTTLRCASLDLKVFPVGSGPRPPQHFGCRSTTAPITRSGRNIPGLPEETRASMDGQVPAKQNYEEFLRKRPAGFQDQVLNSDAKGRLFREGGLSLDKFVSQQGQDLTLDQLQERNATVWNRVFGE